MNLNGTVLQTFLWRRVSMTRIAEEVRYRSALATRPVHVLLDEDRIDLVDASALSPEQQENHIGTWDERASVNQIVNALVREIAGAVKA